jgi:rubrerythrin
MDSRNFDSFRVIDSSASAAGAVAGGGAAVDIDDRSFSPSLQMFFDNFSEERLDAILAEEIERENKKRQREETISEDITKEQCIDRLKCVICLDRYRSVMFLPCRHLVVCFNCTVQVRDHPLRPKECPVCKQTFDTYISAFM